MTPEELNDIKSIAEFDGWKEYDDRYNSNNGRVVMIKEGKKSVFLDMMKYNASWNWLMPVVKQISTLTDDPEINTRFKILIENFVNTLEIDQAFFGTVQFIKWYNKYQKQ